MDTERRSFFQALEDLIFLELRENSGFVNEATDTNEVSDSDPEFLYALFILYNIYRK